MKTIATKNQMPTDTITEGPGISFQHLSDCYFVDNALNDHQGPAYGFPASQEESLYTTCCLMKDFLKC